MQTIVLDLKKPENGWIKDEKIWQNVCELCDIYRELKEKPLIYMFDYCAYHAFEAIKDSKTCVHIFAKCGNHTSYHFLWHPTTPDTMYYNIIPADMVRLFIDDGVPLETLSRFKLSVVMSDFKIRVLGSVDADTKIYEMKRKGVTILAKMHESKTDKVLTTSNIFDKIKWKNEKIQAKYKSKMKNAMKVYARSLSENTLDEIKERLSFPPGPPTYKNDHLEIYTRDYGEQYAKEHFLFYRPLAFSVAYDMYSDNYIGRYEIEELLSFFGKEEAWACNIYSKIITDQVQSIPQEIREDIFHRGDVIRLGAMYRNDGVNIWDGSAAKLEYDLDEYGHVPLEYKFPEFPPEYWIEHSIGHNAIVNIDYDAIRDTLIANQEEVMIGEEKAFLSYYQYSHKGVSRVVKFLSASPFDSPESAETTYQRQTLDMHVEGIEPEEQVLVSDEVREFI